MHSPIQRSEHHLHDSTILHAEHWRRSYRQASVSWKYLRRPVEQLRGQRAVGHPGGQIPSELRSHGSANDLGNAIIQYPDEYCNICNPFQYDTSIDEQRNATGTRTFRTPRTSTLTSRTVRCRPFRSSNPAASLMAIQLRRSSTSLKALWRRLWMECMPMQPCGATP